MTRIRYSKNGPEIFVSKTSVMLPTGELINIILQNSTNTYQFVNTKNQDVVSTGTAKNLLTLKKLVRDTLLELGVPLQVEVKQSSPRLPNNA